MGSRTLNYTKKAICLSCWDTEKEVLLPITQLWERRLSYDIFFSLRWITWLNSQKKPVKGQVEDHSYQTRSFDKVPRCKDRKLLRKLQLDVIYRELRHQCISVTKAMLKIFSIFLRGQSLSRCTHFENSEKNL